jgi:hypothetical protein
MPDEYGLRSMVSEKHPKSAMLHSSGISASRLVITTVCDSTGRVVLQQYKCSNLCAMLSSCVLMASSTLPVQWEDPLMVGTSITAILADETNHNYTLLTNLATPTNYSL